MSLRFIFGRSGSGKSDFCLNNIKWNIENIEKIKNRILIVPEQFSFESQKKFLNIVGEKGMLYATVLDFKRMAYTIFNEVGGITKSHINSSGKCMLLYYILENMKDEFKTFKMAANKRGFVQNISDIISEFKRFNINYENLKLMADTMENNEILKNKLLDISKVYGEFETILHKEYIDDDDDLTIVASKIDNWNGLEDSEIWIDEFSSFTPQQYVLIEKILKRAKRVNICLCKDGEDFTDVPPTNIFSVIANTEERLIKLAINNNIKIEKPIILDKENLPRFKNSKDISFMEKNLFKYSSGKYCNEAKNIKIFRASNPYTEVEEVSREIIKLCRDKKYRFKDIAVVTRELENYENIVSAIFNEYEIPYFIDNKKDIDNNLIIVFLKSIIEIFSKNWNYESIFRYLKTGFVSIDRMDIDILENYALKWGIKGKKNWTMDSIWETKINEEKQKDIVNNDTIQKLEYINEIRKNVIKPIEEFQSNLNSAKTIKEMCTSIYEFLLEIGVPETVEQCIEKFKKLGNEKMVSEYSQIWNVLMELLDQMVEVLGEKNVKLDEFISIMSVGISQYKIGLIPPSLDELIVGSIDRIKTHDIKALFILGVNDGVFPSGDNKEGILTDNDRITLKEKGLEIAKDTKTRVFEEQFLVYKTLTIPCCYLYISYPASNSEGKALRPSIIISRLKNMFPKIKEHSDLLETIVEDENFIFEKITRKLPTFNEMITYIRSLKEESKNISIWKDIYKWFCNNDEWFDKCEKALSIMGYTNQVNSIKKEKVRKLYGEKLNCSVSRLEQYIKCPFGYYIKYGLKIKEREEFKITAPDRGTLMHNAIDKFCKEIKRLKISWSDIDRNWCEKKISEIVQEEVKIGKNTIFNSTPRNKYLTSRLERVVTKTIMVVVEQMKKSGFYPVAYEKEFGLNSNYPPIIVELPSGEKVNIIGKIDRIDVLEKDGEIYIRIIDYKSGNKEFKLSDVYYGLQMQLLLYLDAVLIDEKINTKKDVYPAGVLYFKIDDPIIKNKKNLSQEELQSEIMKALKMQGIVLNNVDVIKEMDKDIKSNSNIIPVSITKSGEVGKRSSVATQEQFEILRKHVRKKIIECCYGILQGNIKINPCKMDENTSCEYCVYSAICQFDTNMEDNTYKIINKLSNEAIWKLIENENKRGEEVGEN